MAIKVTVKGKTCRVKSCGVRLTKRNKSSSGNICKSCWAEQRRDYVNVHKNEANYKKSKRKAYDRWFAKVLKAVDSKRYHLSRREAIRLYKDIPMTDDSTNLWYSREELTTE